jgi:hypothetical protein
MKGTFKVVAGTVATLKAPEPGLQTFRVRMDTDDYAPEFRKGMDLLIDPDRAKSDGCFVLVRIKGGAPQTRLSRWHRTGRNHRGHRVKTGDPRECFRFDELGFRYDAAEEEKSMDWIEILGVVGGRLMPIEGGMRRAS